MPELDWYAIADVLKSAIDDMNTTTSALCELRYYDGCNTIQKRIIPVLEKMLAKAERMIAVLGGEGYEHEIPELYGEELPPRGAGLEAGTAGERRAGTPRTEEERAERHRAMYGSEEEEEELL